MTADPTKHHSYRTQGESIRMPPPTTSTTTTMTTTMKHHAQLSRRPLLDSDLDLDFDFV
jgi:hypothetical protein